MRQGDPGIVLGPDLDFLRELWALDHSLQKLSKRMSLIRSISSYFWVNRFSR